MKIEGTDAAGYMAVSLSSMLPVNKGPLVMADDTTGEVRYKDVTGEEKSVTLGDHAITIIRNHTLGR